MTISLSYFTVYEEIDLVSILVLVILLVHVITNRANTRVNHAFRVTISLALSSIGCDAVRQIFIYLKVLPWAIITFSVLKALSTLGVLISWLRFSELFLSFSPSARMRFLFWLPAIVTGTGFILSFFGCGTYWAAEPGIYQRGPLFLMEPIAFSSYPLIQMLLYIRGAGNAVTKKLKGDYCKMAAFGIFPSAGVIMQYFSGQTIPCVPPSIMLAVLQGYLVVASREVSLDALTGISSRPTLEKYIQELFSRGELSSAPQHSEQEGDIEETTCYWFLMIDVDHFKSVNDNFGHLEGDRALQITAGVLRDCFNRVRGCLVRYGGDEFAAVVHCSQSELHTLCGEIDVSMEDAVIDNRLPYRLSVSVGTSKLTAQQSPDILSAIQQADDNMYSRKFA